MICPIGIAIGPDVCRPSVILLGMHGSLGMVGRILDTGDDIGLIRLPGLGQFLDALIALVCNGRQSLRIPRLSATVGSALAGIVTELIQLGFVDPVAKCRHFNTSTTQG